MKLKTYPSSVDTRDRNYKSQKDVVPESVDLREWDSPVDNQYQLGSCVGNAMANAYELQVKRLYPDKFVELSRLFIYYNARKIYGEPSEDSGTTVRAGIKAVKVYGVCSEEEWPYDVSKFDVKPYMRAYDKAQLRSIESYSRLASNDNVMDAIASGYPVVVALTVYSDFMTMDPDNSTVQMPDQNSVDFGGHAMCLVGYDKAKSAFIAKNSFGTDWGDNGYCWIPFEYLDTYGFEKWVFDISKPQP